MSWSKQHSISPYGLQVLPCVCLAAPLLSPQGRKQMKRVNRQTDVWLLVQIKPPKGNTIQVGDKKMELIQWHFHTPSEHAFDGERKSMEAHLVHKDSEGMLLPLLLLTGTGSMLSLLLLLRAKRP